MKIYSYLKSGDIVAATDYFLNLGDDKTILKCWGGVQCDINNIKKDPHASEIIGREAVKFALSKGFKTSAAMFLHNISSFHMPNWDEGVDPKVIPGIIEIASQQVELREQLDDKNALGWAYWDHGMTLLVGEKYADAIALFNKSVGVAKSLDDANLAAWSNLFIWKAIIKSSPARFAEGESIMREAGATIDEVGEAWEKEEVAKILASAGSK